MIDWYLKARSLICDIRKKAIDALDHLDLGDDEQIEMSKTIAQYMRRDYQVLREHWQSMFPEETFGYLGRHIGFAERKDFYDIINFDIPSVEESLDRHLLEFQLSLPSNKQVPFISEERILELSEATNTTHDLSKLIKLLREINIAYNNDCFFTVGILIRAVIDHVPPLFGCNSFSEITNNYNGTRSFKKSMSHLNNSLRSLADSYLHVQIRNKESIPNMAQVSFQADVDCLLSEVARIMD